MEAAGADLERIEVIDAVRSEDGQTDLFSLRSHVEQLAGRVLEKGDVSLVIIDPVTAYLEGSDSHKNADVRALFKPLSKMASDTNTAIVCVSHLNKANGGSALLRVTGSLAFVAAARAAFLVALDQDDKDKRLFLPLKNNLSEASTGMAFYIRPMSLGNRIETSKVVWTNERVTITADEALNLQEMRVTRPIDDAAQFLFYFLGSGPKPMKEVLRRAENEGHTEITVKRAKKRLGVKSRKSGISDGWTWELPEGAIDSD
jgi:hypothetical protein